jgi:hypothetical protein
MQVIKALKAGEKVFGAKTNAKNYKMINGAAVIQGDGINIKVDGSHDACIACKKVTVHESCKLPCV